VSQEGLVAAVVKSSVKRIASPHEIGKTKGGISRRRSFNLNSAERV